MCSASQPSSRAITDAMRSAKHFLPSSALPPYPEPYDQISRVSGKCTMYLLSASQGHGTSASPGSSGAPTECRHGTQSPSASTSSAAWPMRVMIRIDTATYAESVSCTPMWAMRDPSGPIEKGTTYIVRPRIAPSYNVRISARMIVGVAPVVVRSCEVGRCGADERAVLDTGDVGGVGVRPVAVGALGVGESGERAGLDEAGGQAVVLLGAAIAPVHRVGLQDCCPLVDPRSSRSFLVVALMLFPRGSLTARRRCRALSSSLQHSYPRRRN